MTSRTVSSTLIALAAIAALAVACATSGVNRGDFNVVSIEEEWELGSKLAADLAQIGRAHV